MIKKLLNKNRGFTLVELVVVIGIIGVLSAIVYANFGDSRKLARDDIRKTTLKDTQLAIELYKAQNGVYPEACRGADSWSGSLGTSWACPTIGDDNYIVGLVPDYIAELPKDLKTANTIGYIYRTSADRKEYKLMAHKSPEIKFINSYDDEFARCNKADNSTACPNAGPDQKTYAVYSNTSNAWRW